MRALRMDVKQEKLGEDVRLFSNRFTVPLRDSEESCFQAPVARIPSYRVASVPWAVWVTLLTVPPTHAWPSIASGDHITPLLFSKAA